ncbi:DUF1302 domain-containing protein [Ralstonia flatus]|uniref:DUF1302 domain-containing protein n=1 Tax=Ralstonia flatus TaxID=3058601 RepID=A0ABM9L2G4_9RALS|nr:DUF1302 family protein [Ralstonia sp. LMG 32965]CAJ0896162.1 hypothetical protein R77564_03963 [Ralstonia sp. LMG 32965]
MKKPKARRSVNAVSPLFLASVAMLFGGKSAHAFEMEGWSDIKARWDNTIKYTGAFRLKSADTNVANQNGMQPNTDFGDLGNRNGLINSRFDLLSELDVKYQNIGFRVSGAYWNDSRYTRGANDFNTPVPNTQAAAVGGANNAIPHGTARTMGERADLMDAFVFGQFDIGEHSLTLRAGQHTLLYGESLFLGMNGIAAAQGPVDAIKALSLPNTQFKEIALPVPQVSGSFSIAPDMSIGAYYQFGWRANRIPAAGSYFSAADFVGDGADLLLLPPAMQQALGAPTPFATRGPDAKGRNSGQFGMQFRFKVGDVDYGLYAARYDDKSPIPVLNVPSIAMGGGNYGSGTYNLMYARKIDVYGASFSTVVGETNVAGEISTRRNVPLVVPGDLIMSSNPAADNDRNTPYARGNSLHLNLSAISVLSGNALWGGASLVGELAYNRLLDISYRPVVAPGLPDPVSSTSTRDAATLRVVFTPTFFQVWPNVDVDVPIGIGYGLFGRSAVVHMAPEHGGDLSLGMVATIHRNVKLGLNYTHFFGGGGSAPSLSTGPTPTYASYQQFYKDRDFIALTLQTTF